MRHALVVIGLLAIGGCASQAQPQRAEVPQVCRTDVNEHCRGVQPQALRACVRENLQEFSPACRQEIRSVMGGRRADRQPGGGGQRRDAAQQTSPTRANIVYRAPIDGVPDSSVSLDFFAGPDGIRAPVVVFVHGGGWAIGDKRGGEHGHPEAIRSAGYAYVSVNYRLIEYGPPDVAADDIAASLLWLRRNATELNIDPDRIVLMGHSAGAQLAALVALDPRYLVGQGVPVEALEGVVLLDGAGYDIASQVANGRNAEIYEAAFGTDRNYWDRMSPITYANRANPPAFLLHYVAHREASALQTNALARALRSAGGRAEVHAAADETHESINRGFGEVGDQTTERTQAFLRALGS